VQSKVLVGEPAEEILRYTDENDVGLIAMTSRGLSIRGPWLLGNIAAKVLRATTKPVLLVRTPAIETAVQQKRLVKRILVPLDGSELGAAAIPHAEALGQDLEAELILLQVLEPVAMWAGSEVPYYTTDPPEKSKKLAITYLENVGRPLKEKGLKVSTVIAVGYPADLILDYAKEKLYQPYRHVNSWTNGRRKVDFRKCYRQGLACRRYGCLGGAGI